MARFVRWAHFELFHSSGRVFSHLTAGDSSEPGKYNIILSRGEVADGGWGRAEVLRTRLYCSNWYRIILVYLLKFGGIQFNFIISDVSQIKVVFILRMFSFIDDMGK